MAADAENRKRSVLTEAFDGSFQIFAVLAVAAGVLCYFLMGGDVVLQSLRDDASMVAYLLPKLVGAVLIAGFIQELLPPGFFGRYMGEENGVKGMAIATVAGTVTPGGPMTSFPFVTLLRATGTGIGSLVAYVTAWTTMGLQRVLMWEVPLMGAEFAIIRFVASMPLAIIAGMLARLFPSRKAGREAGRALNVGTVALWGLAITLGVLVWLKRGAAAGKSALSESGQRALNALPRIVVAIVMAGFAGQLIPGGVVAKHIGPESGFYGVLIAMIVGGFIPGGPIISFPLVVVLSEAGAGLVQLVTLVTAWSVFAMHRVIIYEVPMMGLRFSMIRLASSLPLPLIAAGLTALLLQLFAG